MKKYIDEFISIEDETLLLPYSEKLKLQFKKSALYDDLSYINFCDTIQIYINQFKSSYYRKLNRDDILLYGGF